MKTTREGFHPWAIAGLVAATLFTLLLCICLGSVTLPFGDTVRVLWSALWGLPMPDGIAPAIVLSVRLPRAVCVALTGASLALCGGAMQGLLRNPLADGSTLGVASGASLGAVIAIAFGITFPALPLAGTMLTAMAFGFLSLLIILSLAYRLDGSLSTNTIILVGVVFSMFASSIINLIVTFRSERMRSITFWTMGSLQGSDMTSALFLAVALLVCGTVIISLSRELNAFSLGEDNARAIGVNVRRVKLVLLICVSALIGVCVSIGGAIGFVGLVTPHMLRLIVGPNHKRLLPASLFGGAIFLLLSDLVARTLLSPIELPIGVVTSLIGAVAFILIFYRSRKEASHA